MGTSCVLVVHRPDQLVETLMEPYSACLATPEYTEVCPCTGAQTSNLQLILPLDGTEDRASLARQGAPWRFPDPFCERCGGTGIRSLTYNSKARWDTYCVGGNCSDALTGYDPSTDPENWEACRLCHGTGRRPETIAVNPALGCIGCQGEGRRLKHPSQWKPYAWDTLPVAQVLRNVPNFVPSAVVTPDGRWVEEGLHHRLALPPTREQIQARKPRVSALLAPYPECLATVVWCHY